MPKTFKDFKERGSGKTSVLDSKARDGEDGRLGRGGGLAEVRQAQLQILRLLVTPIPRACDLVRLVIEIVGINENCPLIVSRAA